MRNTNKKGFTIVELVIVIAVIAVLAAVLIPTFSSLIAKANLSNDQQVVANMNKALAVEFAAAKPASAGEAITALAASGFYGDKLDTYSKGYHYVYHLESNTMYLIDDEGAVVYPENNKPALGDMWALYGNYNSDYINGVTKYVATQSINDEGYFEVFNNGTEYMIDLNNNVVTVKSDANVTFLNGSTTVSEYVNADNNVNGVTEFAPSEEGKINGSIKDMVIDTAEGATDYSGAKVYYINSEEDEIVIENCVFQGNSSNEFVIGTGGKKVIIRNCVFTGHSAKWALTLDVGAGGVTLENNTFVNCARGVNIRQLTSGAVVFDGNTFDLTSASNGKNNAIQISTLNSDPSLVEIKNNTFSSANAAVVVHNAAVSTGVGIKADYITFAGNTLAEGVKAVIADPDYKDLSSQDQKTKMEEVVAALSAKFN